MREACTLTGEIVDPAEELAAFAQQHRQSGAIASFTGLARSTSTHGVPVTALFLDHHPRLTIASMHAIHDEAMARFALAGARVVHRYGLIEPEQAIVFVAAAAPHRRAAFDAVDCMMDRLKTEAVFWKREQCGDGDSAWIEPTADDYAARARWDR